MGVMSPGDGTEASELLQQHLVHLLWLVNELCEGLLMKSLSLSQDLCPGDLHHRCTTMELMTVLGEQVSTRVHDIVTIPHRQPVDACQCPVCLSRLQKGAPFHEQPAQACKHVRSLFVGNGQGGCVHWKELASLCVLAQLLSLASPIDNMQGRQQPPRLRCSAEAQIWASQPAVPTHHTDHSGICCTLGTRKTTNSISPVILGSQDFPLLYFLSP